MLLCLSSSSAVLRSLSGRERESQSDGNELPHIDARREQEVQDQGLHDRVPEERSVDKDASTRRSGWIRVQL